MLDERDLEIVTALREDARATYADIAARVGLSASSVHERVRKLEASGMITALPRGRRPGGDRACSSRR